MPFYHKGIWLHYSINCKIFKKIITRPLNAKLKDSKFIHEG